MGNNDVAALGRMSGLVTPMALRAAVTLGLPDRLRGDGATTDRLAADLGVSPVALDILLGHLTTLGVVERTAAGYRTTDLGTHLCADADNLLPTILNMNTAAGRADLAFVEIIHSITTGQAAYPVRYGKDFWADLAEHPHLRASFDRQMTMRFRADLPKVVAGVDWSRFATVVDVGGGHGTLLAAILVANPGLHGHLVDLDPTATEARNTFHAQNLDDRTDVTAGSFFDPLPAGADAYVLVDIIHNWDDEHARRILARCVEAAHPGSRVLVLEAVGGRQASTEMDLSMLVHFGGRERGLDDLRALGTAASLTLDTVTTVTDQRCLLEFSVASER